MCCEKGKLGCTGSENRAGIKIIGMSTCLAAMLNNLNDDYLPARHRRP